MELDELPERLGLVGVDDVPGEELMKADLLLQVLKVGLLVQGDVGHVLEAKNMYDKK